MVLLQDNSLSQAKIDLVTKCVYLNPEHYGDLSYILAYTGTFNSLQFHTIDMKGEVSPSRHTKSTSSCSSSVICRRLATMPPCYLSVAQWHFKLLLGLCCPSSLAASAP